MSPTAEAELDEMMEADTMPVAASEGVWAKAPDPAPLVAKKEEDELGPAASGPGPKPSSQAAAVVGVAAASAADVDMEAADAAAADAAVALLESTPRTSGDDSAEAPTLETPAQRLGAKQEMVEEVNTAPSAEGVMMMPRRIPVKVKKPEPDDDPVAFRMRGSAKGQPRRPSEVNGVKEARSRSPRRAALQRSKDILMKALPRHVARKVLVESDDNPADIIDQAHKLRPDNWPDASLPGGGDNPDIYRRLPDRKALEQLSSRMLKAFVEKARGSGGATDDTEAFCSKNDLSKDTLNAMLMLPKVLQARVRNAGAVVGFNKDAVVMWRINRVLQGAVAESKPPQDKSEFIAENWISRETMTSMDQVDPQVLSLAINKGPLYGPSSFQMLQERIQKAEEAITRDIEKSQKEAARAMEDMAPAIEAPTILPPNVQRVQAS